MVNPFMDRRDFLSIHGSNASPVAVKRASRRASTGLTPVTGNLTKAQALHLLRRCLFGVRVSEMKSFTGMDVASAVDALLNVNTTPSVLPLNYYGNTTTDPDVAYGQTWVTAPFNGTVNFLRRSSWKFWHLGQTLNQDTTILEKMVLFWHNHFVTESESVPDARMNHLYLKTIRDNALGNFKTLTKAMTLDPAMLYYLNGYLNVKTAPDENYARELQELFTLGKGPDSKYTEDDVKAAARILTGWSISVSGSVPSNTFTLSKHDTTDKSFSSFFGNATIKGKNTSNAGDLELDDLLTMIFNQNEVAKFICRKLYRYFVYYDITPEIETNVIAPLADHFRNNNYDIKSVLAKLLKSEHFFDPGNMACIIKDPISDISGFCRQMEMAFPPASNPEVQYTHWGYLHTFIQSLQLNLGDPPNVAGWPAWYQEPLFYRSWITSDSLPKRNQFTDAFLYTGFKRGGFTTVVDTLIVTKQFSHPEDADQLIAEAVEFLIPMALSSSQISGLREILLPGGIPAYNWTDDWNAALNTGASNHATALSSVIAKLKSLYKAIMNLSEYQLS
ncbi:MAG: DUF1800 domain-containing protein [Bacteroidetes bacterium]|nr:DUF1800 domain-containing protein [Bacteroidota bacterium]